jgi:hypothetical protein
MKPSMPAPVFSQNAVEALNLLQKAETSQAPVQVTPKGNIKILHQKPTQLPASKLAVVEAVLDKIQSEAAELSQGQTGRNILSFLSLRMPSLNTFVVSGQLGNLREEWQTVREELDHPSHLQQEAFEQLAQNQQQGLKQRVQIADAMSQVLPTGLHLSIEDGVAATLDHVFSEAAQEGILECCRNGMVGSIDKATGFTKQALSDFHRQDMTFVVQLPAKSASDKIQESKKEFGPGKSEEKIAALRQLAGKNPKIAATLSGVLNQEIFKVMDMHFGLDTPTPSGNRCITVQTIGMEETVSYSLKKRTDGNFELTMLRLRSTEKLVSMDGRQEWKINSGEEFKEALSETNFGEKQTAKLLFEKFDLERGILNPIFLEPPTQSFRVCPDYADIQMRAQRSATNPQAQWITL